MPGVLPEKLTILKGHRIRDVIYRIPSDAESFELGLTMQWSPFSATDQIWHILDVAPQSPADMAGLLPYSDYIIGTPETMIRGESGLYELVQEVWMSDLIEHAMLTFTSIWTGR